MRLYVLQHAHQAMKNSGALNCFPVTKENTFLKLPFVLPYRIISYYFHVYSPAERQGGEKLLVRLIKLFSSTVIFSKRRKISTHIWRRTRVNFKMENSSTRLKTTHKGIWDTGPKEDHNNLWIAHARQRPWRSRKPPVKSWLPWFRVFLLFPI